MAGTNKIIKNERLEKLSECVRKGTPIYFSEALEVMEYQNQLKQQNSLKYKLMRDRYRYPIVLVKGKPIKNCLRIIVQNIKKLWR